jgi:hypothetical protein
VYIGKQEMSQISELTFHLKETKKCRVNEHRRQELIDTEQKAMKQQTEKQEKKNQ